jgi:DNA-binding NarL/FixJ family response regulator
VVNATTRRRVFLVEDDPVLRGRFAADIETQPDLTLAGSAATLAEALAWLRGSAPDVMLCDLGLPDGSGIEAIEACVTLHRDCPVMVITVFGDDEHVFRSLEAGATGYLLKESTGDEIAGQIRTLLDEGSPISPQIARRVLLRMGAARPAPQPGPADEDIERLSPREIEVLKLLSKGFSNQEVAQLFDLSAHTVSTYVRRIYRKLAVHSRAEASFEAHQRGLLDARPSTRTR